MKLLNEEEMNMWAWNYCIDKDDNESVAKMISEPVLIYAYCTFIKCRPDLRQKISDKLWNYFKRNTVCSGNKWYIAIEKGKIDRWLTIDKIQIEKYNERVRRSPIECNKKSKLNREMNNVVR